MAVPLHRASPAQGADATDAAAKATLFVAAAQAGVNGNLATGSVPGRVEVLVSTPTTRGGVRSSALSRAASPWCPPAIG